MGLWLGLGLALVGSTGPAEPLKNITLAANLKRTVAAIRVDDAQSHVALSATLKKTVPAFVVKETSHVAPVATLKKTAPAFTVKRTDHVSAFAATLKHTVAAAALKSTNYVVPSAALKKTVPAFSLTAAVSFPTIAGIETRLRADLGITGNPCSVILDQAGSGNTFNQATGAQQPAIQATGINGKQSLGFNGTSSNMAVVGGHAITGDSVWAVIETTDTRTTPSYAGNAANTILGSNNGGVNRGFGVGAISAAGKVTYRSFNGTAWQILTGATSVNDGNPHMIAVTHDHTTGAVIIYVDGVSDATGTFVVRADGSLGTFGGGYSGVTLPGDLFTGSIGEVVTHTGVLTTGNIASYHKYCQSRWGSP